MLPARAIWISRLQRPAGLVRTSYRCLAMHPVLTERMERMYKRHSELNASFSDNLDHKEFSSINKELTSLAGVAEAAGELLGLRKEIEELQEVIANEKKATEPSKELIDMATMEMSECYVKEAEIEERLQTLLVPADPDVDKNAILEVRAGVGGDEACLFAEDIFKMYKLYANHNGWKFSVIACQDGNTGGYKEASASITGENVYGKLKWESGVHRVQRVPATEGSGRIHTSAMTVAVLPEVEEAEFVISPADLKIDVYRASGAGGQHVNTTESAVRITHLPSGLVVTNQNERSQHQNKAMAMKHLRSLLYENHRSKHVSANAELRASQIGSGDRSERIRTYNFPDDRVTDHRINKTVNNLGRVLRGESLDELIDEIRKVITSKKLEAMIKQQSK